MFLRNTRKAKQVWDRLGKMLWREGEKLASLAKLYHVVIHALLMFGVETWVLLAPMTQWLYGVHVGFLRQVTELKANRLKGGLCQKVAIDKVLQGAGTQPLKTYLDRMQAKVAEWVALRTILETCTRKMGYKEGEKLQDPWRIHTSVE